MRGGRIRRRSISDVRQARPPAGNAKHCAHPSWRDQLWMGKLQAATTSPATADEGQLAKAMKARFVVVPEQKRGRRRSPRGTLCCWPGSRASSPSSAAASQPVPLASPTVLHGCRRRAGRRALVLERCERPGKVLSRALPGSGIQVHTRCRAATRPEARLLASLQ